MVNIMIILQRSFIFPWHFPLFMANSPRPPWRFPFCPRCSSSLRYSNLIFQAQYKCFFPSPQIWGFHSHGDTNLDGWFTWTIPAISMDDWGYPYDLGNLEKIGQPKMVKPLWMTCWKFALRITKTGGWKGLELYFKVARDVSLRILRFQVFLARNDWTYLLYHL